MDNTYKSQYSTLASMFNIGWGNESAVQYENLLYTPVVGTKWCRFSVNNGEAFLSSIGSPLANATRYTGVVIVQCFTPLGLGSSTALEMADKAINIFNGQVKEGYHFRAGYSVKAGDSDGWHQVNAIIPFWRDSYGRTEPVITVPVPEP